jgi:hypothetical protein
VLPFFGVSDQEADWERMRQVGQFDAKNPARSFEADRTRKQREAGERLRALADRPLQPAYDGLEAMRAEQERRGLENGEW